MVAQLTFMQMQEEKRRSDNAVAEENIKLILQSHAKEVKQVLASAYLHFYAHMHRVFAPAAADECMYVPNVLRCSYATPMSHK